MPSIKILSSPLPLWHIWLYAKLNSGDSINEDGLMLVHHYNGPFVLQFLPVS